MTIIAEGLHEALPVIRKFAPIISSVIGGLPGFAASSALSLLSKAFTPDSNTSNFSGLVNAILNDSSAGEKLQELEKNHSGWLIQATNMKKIKKAEINITLEWDNNSQESQP